MITNQDLEDLKLLKILQDSKDWGEYKELKEHFNRSFNQLFEMVEKHYYLAEQMMRGIHEIRDIIKKEEEITKKILKTIENNKPDK